MIEDPDSKAQEVIRGCTQKIREILSVRLLMFQPGLGEVQGFGNITIRLYEEGSTGIHGDAEGPFFIAVSRRFGNIHDQSIWKFMPDNTMEREGMVVTAGKVTKFTKYGKGLSAVSAHSLEDAEILLDLARDPAANFSEAGSLSFLDGKARGSRRGAPGQSGRSRL